METCCKVFDFEEYRSYFLTTILFSASSFLVCSIHRYMVTSSLRNSGQWLSLSGSGSNPHICACVWVGTHGVGTFVPHIHIVCIFTFQCHAKHSRGSGNFFRIQDGAGREDGFLTAGPVACPCKPVTCILTQACMRYLCICTSVCMHVCFMCVCLGE